MASDEALDVATLPDASIAVTGSFRQACTFVQGRGSVVLDTGAARVIFVPRCGAESSLAWAKAAGGSSADDWAEGPGPAVDADGSLLLAGWFEGTATFGSGDPGQTTLDAGGAQHLFAARTNADGGF